MTCGFCRYQFCWACGASASTEDNHFGPMRGCGVRMMDQTAKANSRKDTTSMCKNIGKKIGITVLCIPFLPFILVFFLPYMMCKKLWEKLPFRMALWKKVCCCIPLFLLGLLLDVIFVPFLCLTLTMLAFYAAAAVLVYVLTCFKCFEPCRIYLRARRNGTGVRTQAE